MLAANWLYQKVFQFLFHFNFLPSRFVRMSHNYLVICNTNLCIPCKHSFHVFFSLFISKELTKWLFSYNLHSLKFKLHNQKLSQSAAPSVNFINVLRAAFTLVDPKSANMTVKLLAILRFWDL